MAGEALKSALTGRIRYTTSHRFDTSHGNDIPANYDGNVVDLMRGRETRAALCPCPSRCGGGEITANACRKSLVYG